MTSLKAPLGFSADFLKSGAQSAIPNYEGPPKAARRRTREQDELILWFYEVAMTSGLPASDRTNDISNYRLDARRYSRCCQCQIARWNVP